MGKTLTVAAIIVALVVALVMAYSIARKSEPVCHAKTEDSIIYDCDYRHGGWYRK